MPPTFRAGRAAPRRSLPTRRLQRIAAWAAGFLVAGAAHAAMAAAPAVSAAPAVPARSPAAEIKPFTGTLQRIYETGIIRIGHRLNSPPFAFLGPDGQPIGYSLDICEVVIEEVARHLHRAVDVTLVPVTPENRFDLVRNGQVDLECGSSTANDERRAYVEFSPTIFVTGTRLLVKRGSRIRSLRDLQGRTLALTRGTVHAAVVPRLVQQQGFKIDFLFTADHDESFAAVAEGRADAFANDDIQLAGMIAVRNAAPDYRVVGASLTYADYALVLRRDDPDFAGVVGQAFERLSGSGEIRAIYRRWFQRPLPSGIRLNLPMSPHLEHVFRLEGQYSD